ncbi:MAG: protease inhibitor I42 family protein [Methanobacterium sp. ERen5]|nr:MAG: protease inhibitor I42 family protein [Methanobacterium sp. ERen5]
MKKFGILLLTLTVLLMTSGAYATDSNLKLSDNTIGVGDEFVVTLADNSGSTGYEWMLRASTSGVILVSQEYLPPISMAPGYSGKRIFVFKATEPGIQSVMFELLRSWDTMNPVDRKIYNINVV